MVRAAPGGVLKISALGFPDSMVDEPDEQAAIANSAVPAATDQVFLNTTRIAKQIVTRLNARQAARPR